MNDASDETNPKAPEDPQARGPEQPDGTGTEQPNSTGAEPRDEAAPEAATETPTEAAPEAESESVTEAPTERLEATGTDDADVADDSYVADDADASDEPSEETSRWAPPTEDGSADPVDHASPADVYPPDASADPQGSGPHSPAAGGYVPSADPYVQDAGHHPQGSGPYPQPGAYGQASYPYPPAAGAYGQGSGPHPQGPGPYQQADPYGQSGPYAAAGPSGPYPPGAGAYAPGSGPMPYPAAPGQPGHGPRSKFTSALAKGATWKTALIPPGIALLGGIVASIILTMLVSSMSDFTSLTEDTGFNLDGISYAMPFILLALSLFGSAVLRLSIQAPDAFDAQLSIFMVGAPLVVTIIIVGLLWWLTKRSERSSPAPNRVATWVRIGISTLSMTLVLFFLQLIFAARFSTFEDEGTFTFSLSAITARSFFLPLLVILVTSIAGRVAGHFKGTEAIGAPFLRWAVPPLLVTWIHLIVSVGVFSIVALFVLPFSIDMPGQLVPLTFINMGLILTSLSHFGGISASAQGDLGFYSDSFSENLTLFSQTAPGQLWLGLLVVVAAVLISTFVATVTRRPSWTVLEQDKLQWSSAWKLPLAFCLVWGLLSLLAIPMRMSMSGSAEAAMIFGGAGAARLGIGPLAWTFPSSPCGAGSSRCCPGRSDPGSCSPSRPSRGSPPAGPCTRTGARTWE